MKAIFLVVPGVHCCCASAVPVVSTGAATSVVTASDRASAAGMPRAVPAGSLFSI